MTMLLEIDIETGDYKEKVAFPYEGEPLVDTGQVYDLDGFAVRFFRRDGSYEDFIGPVVCPDWAVAQSVGRKL